MSMLEVSASPAFARRELDWLMRLRQKRAKSLGPPRFTLVFPGASLEQPVFIREVTAAVAGVKRIEFCLRAAMVVPNAEVHSFHVFLVPDEGFAAILKLHARLHQGALSDRLRPEVPYIPHVTVASEPDVAAARALAASLNAQELAISGRIDELEIHRRDGLVVRSVAKAPLVKPGLFG